MKYFETSEVFRNFRYVYLEISEMFRNFENI